RWAMIKGEESLRLELARRRAQTEQDRALIPAPPQSQQDKLFWLTLGLVAVVVCQRLKSRQGGASRQSSAVADDKKRE
ncbi:MAG: hypothetical protein M3347_18735, partial [Armatimonadota bacterium]|nr:hypothetical protein [Armatimonadota bacterium]